MRYRLLTTLLTISLVMLGCPSEEPTDDDSNVTDDDDDDVTPDDDDDDDVTGDDDDSANPVVLSEDTRLPEDEAFFESVQMEEDQLVFTSSGSGEDFGFEVGNVVVGCAGDCYDGVGYLRRVTAIEIDGTTATLQTEMASLADAVENGSFEWVIPLSSREVVDLSGTELYSANNLELSIVNGSLTVDPTLELAGDYTLFSVDWFVGSLDIDFGLDMDIQALTTASVDFGDEVQIVELPEYRFTFMLGMMPVVGSAQITVVAGFEAEIDGEASVTTGFDVNSEMLFGAAYYFGSWETSWDPSVTGNHHAPVVNVSSDASLKVFIGATVSTIFYEVGGPSLGVEPYLLGEANFAPPPPTYELYAGITGDLGFELDVFSIQLADWETELIDWNTLLYEYTFADDLDGDGYYDFEDCDDGDVNTHPGATEVCDDSTDNDCDLDYDCDDVDCMYDLACLPACSNGLDDDGDGWTDLDDPGCGGDPSGADEGGYDLAYECNDGIDNDGDGWIDLDDPECGNATGSEHIASETDCTDGVDDDNDGDTDCDDSDCYFDLACIPACANHLDDDGDGWVDLDDPGCGGDADWYDEGGYDAAYECNDGIDNDGDGSVDADDPECGVATGSEFFPSEGDCNNGADDDNDGDTDCDDSDCLYDLACIPACSNGQDDDGDGWTDLDDPGCAGDPNGADEGGYDLAYECNDGVDNDGDGDVDGADPECGGVATGSEHFASEIDCTNSVDDDGDGLVDCDDPECLLDLACIPACDNGLDDDGDGWMDLDDPGCAGDLNGTDEGGYDATYECNDGVDNDGDGSVDADDPQCESATGDEYPSTETVCDDGIDDDGDGDVDCDDGDCSLDPICVVPLAGYVFIPSGTFMMGSHVNEVGRESYEDEHEVTLTHAFYLGETEATQYEFETVMGWLPNNCVEGCGDEYPVHSLTWFDTLAFANEVSVAAGLPSCYVLSNVECGDGTNVGTSYMSCMNDSQRGIDYADVLLGGVLTSYECEGYRLPTEAEWEYAARAGETAAFSNGGNLYPGDENECSGNLLLDNGTHLDDFAWYCGKNGGPSEPVAGLQSNNWGLYDTSGNVWEWVWDWADFYNGDEIDPPGPPSGYGRVLRGGSWAGLPAEARAAYRFWDDPDTSWSVIGVRLAKTSP